MRVFESDPSQSLPVARAIVRKAMNNLLRWLALPALLPLIGCSFGYDASPPPKAAAPPKAAQQTPPSPAQPVSPQPGPAAKGPAAPALPIRLSAGTALAQTLPEGTTMGFSVDYQFTAGQPDTNAQYFWVVERTQGPPARQPVRLSAQGTLQGFISGFQPEHGPFQGHIEDARGNRLSANESLR